MFQSVAAVFSETDACNILPRLCYIADVSYAIAVADADDSDDDDDDDACRV